MSKSATKKQRKTYYERSKAKIKSSPSALTCTNCKAEKVSNLFYKCCTSSTGFTNRCKSCVQKTWSEKYYSDPSFRAKTIRGVTESKRKQKYGVPPEEFSAILANQNGKCAICEAILDGSKPSLRAQLDHCHKTGRVRGILCGQCNTSLGGFKDSEDLLIKAAKYLSEEKARQ